MNELLKFIEEDSRLTPEQLAMLCKKEVGDIKELIRKYEDNGTILGYTTIIDWDKTDKESVNALIELNVIPRLDVGFDKIATRIANYPEVKSLYLMSGGFDLAVFVEGKTMKEIAFFVARKLASLEDVTSTATHFVLTKFKDKGIIFTKDKKDERGNNI